MRHHHHQLRRFLPRNGMNWGTEASILARPRRDRKVVEALLALRVRARPADMQIVFTEMFVAATRYVECHQLPDDMSLGGFCAVFGRTHSLAQQLASPVVFGDLFEALIFGHSRFVQHAVENGVSSYGGHQAGVQPSPLALAIDAFVAAAPCVSWDSNRALVAVDVDEDVTEVVWDEAWGDWSVVVRPLVNEEAGFLDLAEGLNAIWVEAAEESDDEDEDEDEVMDTTI